MVFTQEGRGASEPNAPRAAHMGGTSLSPTLRLSSTSLSSTDSSCQFVPRPLWLRRCSASFLLLFQHLVLSKEPCQAAFLSPFSPGRVLRRGLGSPCLCHPGQPCWRRHEGGAPSTTEPLSVLCAHVALQVVVALFVPGIAQDVPNTYAGETCAI